jgi:hypothetical protein
MEFKTICTNRRSQSAGFTLIEVLIASGLGTLVLGVLLSASLYTNRTLYAMMDSSHLGSDSRYAIDRMSQKIRQAGAVTAYTTNSVSFDYLGGALSYVYEPVSGTLLEVDHGNKRVLLQNCESLAFELYKRNPITNSFDQYSATGAINEAKLVKVKWFCKTIRAGRDAGSSEMISAKIVLRTK